MHSMGMNADASTQPVTTPEGRTLIERALKASFWRVRLPGDLEYRFRRDTLEARLDHVMRSGWLALLIFNSFLIVDWLMAHDVFWRSVAIRLGGFTPLGVLTLLAAPRLVTRFSHWFVIGMTDWIIVFSGWGAAISLALILHATHSPWAPYYHAGYMVVIIYGNLVQQVSFRHALVFSAGIFLLNLSGILQAESFPAPLRLAMLQLVVATIGFTLAANYLVEKARRRSYLLMLRERQLIEDLSGINQQLQQLSRSDVLTGAANRRHLHDHLAQLWARAKSGDFPVSILMLDVDHFKAYNDRYGHPAGDACLRQVAQALEASLRGPEDLIARYGGEEFAVVMPRTDGDAAALAGERVRQAVEALRIPHEGSTTAPVVTVSVGTATLDTAHPPDSADQLLSDADRALYDAKRAGRNRVESFRLAASAPA